MLLIKKKVSWRLLLTIAAAVLVKHVHWLTPNTDLDQPLRQIAATFGVGKSTVYDIIKNEEKLKTFQTEVEDGDCIKMDNTRQHKNSSFSYPEYSLIRTPSGGPI